jgi:phosphoglycolate phosphatase-like HAD superfamily hydrolase
VKLALDLDRVLGDTTPLWRAWIADASRRFRSIAELDVDTLPPDRGEAAAALDRWASAGIGDWRTAVTRFAEDHAPIYLRPDSETSAALRRLAAVGARLVAFTDAPRELADVAVTHLGLVRRLEGLECGLGAEERALERLGSGAVAVRSREELLHAAT